MAAESFFRVLNAIDSGAPVKPVFFLHGYNEFPGERLISAVSKRFIGEKSDFAYSRFYMETGGTDSWEAVLNEVNSSGFFLQSRKVVVAVIRDSRNLTLSKENKKLLKEYIAQPNENSILIIYLSLNLIKDDYSQVRKQKVNKLLKDFESPYMSVVDFDAIYERDVKVYLKEKLGEDGYSITPSALDRLIELKGEDYIQLINQVDRLVLIASENKTVDADRVEQIISGVETHSIWDLAEAIENENIKEYLKILQYLFINGVKPAYITGTLITHYHRVFSAKKMLKAGVPAKEIGRILRQPPFILNRFLGTVRKFPEKKISKILDVIHKLDLESKSGGEDLARLSLQNFIFQVRILR